MTSPHKLEMDRILALPVQDMLDEEGTEVFCVEQMLAEAYDRGERLFPTQASAVRDYLQMNGGLFPVGVGWGKTGISLMVANLAFEQGRARRSILLVQPQQVIGLVKRHIPEWRRRVPMSVPFHFLGGRSRSSRMTIARSGAAGCYVLPYSLLKPPDALEMADLIRPQLLIVDEAQNLKNRKSGRTKCFLAIQRKHEARLVAMSGTMTSKSVLDYHHLSDTALEEGSPIPRSGTVVRDWDAVINASAERPTGFVAASMVPLVGWARERFPDQRFREDETESFRRAYRLRLNSAPGVTATGDNEIGVSLCLSNHEIVSHVAEPSWTRLHELIKMVEGYETPDGDPIDHAFHTFRWLDQLTSGMYLRLVWPTPEHMVRYRHVTEAEAERLIACAKEHHAALMEYHRALRSFFVRSPAELSTPLQVAHSIARHGDKYVPTEVAQLWRAAKDLEVEGMPERRQEPVRVCDYKIQHAVEWARQRGRGIVWVFHQEVGDWLCEELALEGMEPLHAKAGMDDEIEEVGDPGRGGKGDRIVVASISAHGVGKNLQAFQDQLVLQWPRSALAAEQMLGRLHRNGQEADELMVDTCLTTEFDHVARAACLNDAIYIQQTTGARQKVVICDYDPMPVIYSSEFLREQGADPRMLDQSQKRMLSDKFGDPVL